MKLKVWLTSALASLTAASLLAQTSNTTAPVIDAAQPTATAAPAKEAPAAPAKEKKPKAKKKAKAKVESVKKNVVFDPPLAATVKCDVLDVRGQGSFTGEVIGHVKKGDGVMVVEEITLGHVHADEPAHWSKIVMPTNIAVWVDGVYVSSNTVHATKINLRGGPGENYSIVGRIDKGTVVDVIGKKEGWLKIEAPTNAYAFVASEYLDKTMESTSNAVAAAAPTPTPAPEPPTVVNVAPPAAAPAPATAAPVETPPAAPAAPATIAPAPAAQTQQELEALRRATAPEPANTAPAAATPAPTPTPAITEQSSDTPRVETREGFLHRCYNITAPAGYELHDIKTGDLIEYVTPGAGQKIKAYVGTRVRIIGTESLDPRWPRTPLLQIQTIDLMP